MNEVLEFLKASGTFYVATVDGEGKPRLRPFGGVMGHGDKLYIVTKTEKNVADQMKAKSGIAICAMRGRDWIRMEGDIYYQDDFGTLTEMFEANSEVFSRMFTGPDDKSLAMFYYKGEAIIYENGTESKRIML